MGSVGLLYVGAVLILNGVMLLGYVEARSAAPLNLFVGALQVVTPTYLIFTSGGDATTILGASGIYLFGFTYLYVGINLLAGLDIAQEHQPVDGQYRSYVQQSDTTHVLSSPRLANAVDEVTEKVR